MGKDKKRTFEPDEKKVTMFYYEIIGIVLLIISIIILGKMGKVGNTLTMLFKICFGNWYWLSVLGLFILGVFYLFVHKSFSVKSQRFIGFIFLYIVLLVFAHFPIHNYIVSKSGSYFSIMWSVFQSYINGKYVNTLGGGVIGGAFFYIFSMLFGKFGVIVCGGLIIILAISLLLNKPLIEIMKMTKTGFSHIRKYTKSFNNFFRYELGKEESKKHNIFMRSQRINLNLIKDFDNSIVIKSLEKVANDNKHIINTVLNNQQYVYKVLDVIISFHVTTYKYQIYDLNINEFFVKLNSVFSKELMYNYMNNKLSIQIVNDDYQTLTVKQLLISQQNYLDNYNIPIGIDYLNRLIEFDFERDMTSNLLAIGDPVEVENFFNALLVSLLIKRNLKEYQVRIFDFKGNFEYLSEYMPVEDGNVEKYLLKIKDEINERNKIISQNKCVSFSEYIYKTDAEMINPELKREFVIISLLNIDFAENDFRILINEFGNVSQMASKVGVNIIVLIDKVTDLSLTKIFNNIIIFKADVITSKYVLGNDNAITLRGNGDSFYIKKGHYLRLCTGNVTSTKMIEYLSKLK